MPPTYALTPGVKDRRDKPHIGHNERLNARRAAREGDELREVIAKLEKQLAGEATSGKGESGNSSGRHEVKVLEKEIKDERKKRNSAVQELSLKKEDLVTLQASHSQRVNILEGRLQKSDAAVSHLDQDLQEAHAMILRLQTAPGGKKNKGETRSETFKSPISSLEELQTRNTKFEHDLWLKNQELIAVRTSHGKEVASLRSQLAAAVSPSDPSSLRTERAGLQSRIAAQDREIASLKSSPLRSQVVRLEKELATVAATNARLGLNDGKIEQYKSKIVALESTNKFLTNSNSTLARDLSLKEKELAIVKASLKNRLATLESEHATCDTSLLRPSTCSGTISQASGAGISEEELALSAKREKVELREAREEATKNAERVRSFEERVRELMRENEEERATGRFAGTSSSETYSTYPNSVVSTARPSIANFTQRGSEQHSKFVVEQLVSSIQGLHSANIVLRDENTALLLQLAGVEC